MRGLTGISLTGSLNDLTGISPKGSLAFRKSVAAAAGEARDDALEVRQRSSFKVAVEKASDGLKKVKTSFRKKGSCLRYSFNHSSIHSFNQSFIHKFIQMNTVNK